MPVRSDEPRFGGASYFARALALPSRFASFHNFTATASSFTGSVIHPLPHLTQKRQARSLLLDQLARVLAACRKRFEALGHPPLPSAKAYRRNSAQAAHGTPGASRRRLLSRASTRAGSRNLVLYETGWPRWTSRQRCGCPSDTVIRDSRNEKLRRSGAGDLAAAR